MIKNNLKPDLKEVTGKPDFLISLNLRQNASWQGELHWLNAERRVRFRSLLEMINLLQEAIDISSEPRCDYEIRSWYDDADEEMIETGNHSLKYIFK